MSSVLESVSPWPLLPREFLGAVDPEYPDETEMNTLLCGMAEIGRGQAYLAWAQYRSAAVMYDRLVAARECTDGFIVDGYADCAARIAKVHAISQRAAEVMLDEAVALRDRLPEVADCLRDGVISPKHVQLIITRTELLDGWSSAIEVDAEIARLLRHRAGSWTRKRLRDMCDRIVFRYDPNAVREQRRQALADRGMWTDPGEDGTATITASMAAENVRIAAASVRALADAVCDNDGRTTRQRASDAMFALLSGTAFDCQCGHAECQAIIPEPATVPPAAARIVLHVVCDEATLTGEHDHAGYLDGHGVISADHVRDIAARADTRISPVVPPGTAVGPDGRFTVAAHLPSDPYRPSSALDTFVRIRDGSCADPGCETSAWDCDLDHVTEYDHQDPAGGGQTTDEGLNAKCRFDHIRKTFGDWVDDQWRDTDGRLRTQFVTPEGLIIPGEAETNEDLFPGLRRIHFRAPDDDPPHRRHRERAENPARSRTRLANKHARRRAERSRNRSRNNAGPPPPY